AEIRLREALTPLQAPAEARLVFGDDVDALDAILFIPTTGFLAMQRDYIGHVAQNHTGPLHAGGCGADPALIGARNPDFIPSDVRVRDRVEDVDPIDHPPDRRLPIDLLDQV